MAEVLLDGTVSARVWLVNGDQSNVCNRWCAYGHYTGVQQMCGFDL